MVMDIFQDVVDKQIFFELLPENEYFFFGFDAIVAVNSPYCEGIRKHLGVHVAEYSEIIR